MKLNYSQKNFPAPRLGRRYRPLYLSRMILFSLINPGSVYSSPRGLLSIPSSGKRTTKPPHSRLHSLKHIWDHKPFSFIWWNLSSVTRHCKSPQGGRERTREEEPRVEGQEGSSRGSLLGERLPQWLALHYLVSHVVLCACRCLMGCNGIANVRPHILLGSFSPLSLFKKRQQ